MKIHENYVGCYSLSKTLQFQLIPMFETEENIKKYKILSNDEFRAETYNDVKKILDKCHKAFIDVSLNDLNIEWTNLYNAIVKYQSDHNKDELNKEQLKYQKLISAHLKKDDRFKDVSAKAVIDYISKSQHPFVSFTDEEKDKLLSFNKFSSYFQGFEQNRANIYATDISTSIAYRVVNDNFPKFVSNLRIFSQLDKTLISSWNEPLKDLLNGNSLEKVFSIDFYNNLLTQKGIDFYNELIGGKSIDETTKIQGINELCNNAFQHNLISKKMKFSLLFKQILSDRDVSFLPSKFENDIDLINALDEYGLLLLEIIKKNSNEINELFNMCDETNVYVAQNQIAYLSQILYDGEWNRLKLLLDENKIKKSPYYSLKTINQIIEVDLAKIIIEKINIFISDLTEKYNSLNDIFKARKIDNFDSIKEFLDSVQNLEKLLKIFAVQDDMDKDNNFYSIFDEIYNVLRENIPLYNKVRNFATQKPYSTEKYKLNFGNPVLSGGWDQNKEYSYNTMLFMKNGKYFLAILNKDNKKIINESNEYTDSAYKKMVYKFLPDPSKMLPKVFFSKKGLETFGVNNYILDGYNASKHKKGDNFDLGFCHELIDYFKDLINKHPDWSKFGFEFSDTSTYRDTSDFYREITKQAYKISFSYVSDVEMKNLVKNGNVFLFQIYNKDFSENSKGTPNLHTLYWNELFTAENLENPIFKLNGQAELFYRPASIKNPFVHKKGSVLVSKNDINGFSVPSELYESVIAEAENGSSVETLKAKYPNLVFKTAQYDIVKDRRYAKAHFSFHVPITINYAQENKFKKFNSSVLDAIQDNPDVNIIGIDRGERNLIYVSCINQHREIIEQKSFNVINGIDYHQKLDDLEKGRDSARKKWKNIDGIKNMKEGYLSLVIKKISDMMIKYNAILVMEDLNYGFKRGRFHIEKQVYQKFEKMLIEKLNYLVDKNKDHNDIGGVRYGYQLTNEFVGFNKLGKQSGFLFYVPASYTSKIDPLTGFVNLFTSNQLSYQSVEKSKAFIKTFKSISYNDEYGFEFEFNYSDFDLYKTDYIDSWTIYSYGDGRIVHTKKDGYDTTVRINVTDELIALMKEYNVDFTNGNIIENICNIDKDKNEKEFFKKFLWLFRSIVQLRYEDKNNDFIMSPVMYENRFFDSRKALDNEPVDGDANGAYHIALQGLRMMSRIENGKINSDEKNKQAYNWFKFVQSKAYQK